MAKAKSNPSSGKSAKKPGKRQGGNTIVAFVFGMVFGLVIAFGVAMYVSKAKLPFSGVDTQGAVANVNPGPGNIPPDPNSALYNKTGSGDANAVAPVTSSTPPDATAPAAAGNSGNQPVAQTVYYLQLGSFRNREDAEQLRAKLAFVGTESEIVVGDSNGTEVNRVRVGPFASANDAYLARAPLTKGGFEATVVKE
ncbi:MULTISPECIES: SPOR domain-containing protein [Limnobacter]|uniref:Cell division protein n=1 Tax=Limnobacter litoralis TaxID=481366 RepID=A0ABQ5YNN4_9BURK|nr:MULTISPECIES: SPOR domain-containing protein [Limnobacter]GLR25531.1 cell division protein [Limnobacter litoralis]HEX5486057.1 SPOR domain-containing protein [Limnobacter sp.]